MSNPSGIDPIEFKVLVKPKPIETKTAGGIILTDTTVEKEKSAAMEGTIIAKSPLAFTYETWPEGYALPGPGDRVLFAKYSGATAKGADGEEYRIINDKDIIAILR